MNMSVVVMAQLLKNSRPVLYAGYLAFIGCFAIYLVSNISMLMLLLMLATIFCVLLHQYIALRVQFDADLLQAFVDQPQLLLDDLDTSLLALNLISEKKTQRSWELRTKGCLKLFKLQFFILLLQYFIFIIMILISFYWGELQL